MSQCGYYVNLAIGGRADARRVQAEARNAGAARTGHGIYALGIDLITGTGHPAPSIGTEGDSSRHGSGVEARENGLARIKFRLVPKSGPG